MALLSCLILFLCFKIRSCQLQPVKESRKDSEFSISVNKHIQVEAGSCIRIPYEVTFPKSKVTVPYKKIWFRTDQQDTISSTVIIDEMSYTTNGVFRMDFLPRGEYEYGFKLEWGGNQTYVFPTTLRISVSESTQKPKTLVPTLEEGKTSELYCWHRNSCFRRPKIYWIGPKALLPTQPPRRRNREREFYLTPTPEDHNTNITCVVEYDNNIIAETTVTLKVEFAPKFQNGTKCLVKGELLVCMCITWGNPPSSITWPVASLTDFSITSYSSGLTVNSTLIMKAADTNNSSVKCISSNKLGQREREIEIGNFTGSTVSLSELQPSSTVLLWIIAVSVSLNLALLISLIIFIYKWGKKSQQNPNEEVNIYTSLNRAQVQQEYSVLTPQPR